MFSLPLKIRVPNEPADFAGREAEAAELVRDISEAVVTVVHGPGGLGKTSLVQKVLHRHNVWPPERCIFVAVPLEQTVDEVKQEVIRMLALSAGQAVDWGAIQSDPQALTESLIDLAETGSWCVVLDDLHHVLAPERDSMLDELARYCRNSRFIVTMRPAPVLARGSFRLLSLAPMSQRDLEQLAQRWGDPGSGETVHQFVARSGGSPWMLRHLLSAGRVEIDAGQDVLFRKISPAAQSLLYLAASIREALTRETWLRLAGSGSESTLAETEKRGFWKPTAGGLRLHEMVKDTVCAGAAVSEIDSRLHEAGRILCQEKDLLAILEGVRVLLLLADFDQVKQVLEPLFGRILESGYAPRLWRLISTVHDARLESLRLRCAAELGNPTVLNSVQMPTDSASRDNLTWAETLYMRGELTQALAAFTQVEGAPGDEHQPVGVVFKACLGRVRTLLALGQPKAATELLNSTTANGQGESLALEVLLAAAGTASIAPFASRLMALPETLRDDLVFELTLAAADNGDVVLAREFLGFSHRALTESPDLFVARRLLCLRVTLETQAGEMDLAENGIAKLQPFIRSHSLLRPDILCASAALHLAQGRVHECQHLLELASNECQSMGAGRTLSRVAQLASRAELLSPTPNPLASPDALVPRAIDGMIRGNFAGAERDLVSALGVAGQMGNTIEQAELLTLLCDLGILKGDGVLLSQHAVALSRLAKSLQSERFGAEGHFFEAVASPRLDAAIMEHIAFGNGGRVGRRARLMLGESPVHNRLDARVVAALQAATEFRPVTIQGSDLPTTGAAWGIDLVGRRVWLASGAWIDFGKRPQYLAVLQVLCRLGGAATKEDLITLAWLEAEYHPLRHDTRLQVAIRKLRELIEEDPSNPIRISTTAEGYRLQGPVRVVR